MSMNGLTSLLRVAALRANPEPIAIPAVLEHAQKGKPHEPLEIRATGLRRPHDAIAGISNQDTIKPHIGDDDTEGSPVRGPKFDVCPPSGNRVKRRMRSSLTMMSAGLPVSASRSIS